MGGWRRYNYKVEAVKAKEKGGGGSEANPLLGTRCEAQNSQQLKITVLFRRQTQWPKGWEGIRSHPIPSLHTNSAHALRYRTECLHPPDPARISHPVLPPKGHLGWGPNWKEKWERAAVPAHSSAALVCSGVDGGERLLCPSREAGTEGYP